MACTEEEFRELLGVNETFVDLERLHQVSKYGIPDGVRSEVWAYLLGVTKSDKSEEAQTLRNQIQEYKNIEKMIISDDVRNIKQELKRYVSKKMRGSDLLFSRKGEGSATLSTTFQSDNFLKRFENVMISYVNSHSDFVYIPNGSIYVLGPFIYLMRREDQAYFCFEALMKKMEEENFSRENVQSNVARFMMYFQALAPELFSYLEDEEVSPSDWATSWLQFLLAKELPFECIFRVWDTYFCCEEGLEMHFYVCLAILVHISEDLMELDHSQLKATLQHLPPFDMDQIIAQAYNVKEDLETKGLL